MDTRTKIVGREIAESRAAGSKAMFYAAGFDVLTAARLRRIREVAEPGALLVAVVTDLPNPLLPTQARAELAASLAIIDLVVIGDLPAPNLIDDTEADSCRTVELIHHMQRRNRAYE